MNLSKGRLCVIHNNVAEASVRLEVSEQRIIAYLTSLINKNDKDFKIYKIAVKDLAAELQINRKDFYKEVKDTTKNLIKKVMTLKRLDGQPGELQVAWLSSAEYEDGKGIVGLEFSPKLKPYLLQLKEHFTKFPLQDVIRFKSQFSMPLYLLLKQYLAIGYREFKIEDLKHKFGLLDKYKQYGHFKSKVLTVALTEINNKTSLDIGFSEIRLGRKVIAVRFIIKNKSAAESDNIKRVNSTTKTNSDNKVETKAIIKNEDLNTLSPILNNEEINLSPEWSERLKRILKQSQLHNNFKSNQE